MASPPITLGSAEAHVWWVLTDEVRGEALEACRALLGPEERERHRRLALPEVQHDYLVAHALLRLALSRHAAVEPPAWVFATDRHGRPELAGPAGHPPLRFNLSHTRGLAACVCALDREVGVDVERVEAGAITAALLEATLSAAEATALGALPPQARPRRFFELWTLKEAYLKARGLGIGVPLDRISLGLETPGHIELGLDPVLEDAAASWQLTLARPGAEHQLAAAVRRGAGGEVRLRARAVSAIDLRDWSG